VTPEEHQVGAIHDSVVAHVSALAGVTGAVGLVAATWAMAHNATRILLIDVGSEPAVVVAVLIATCRNTRGLANARVVACSAALLRGMNLAE